ncbi:MAG: hypothetical protein JWP78_346 [Mucilaginibacter sp.]|nr:hypothetical protein [Mucilaginibacter sp.]
MADRLPNYFYFGLPNVDCGIVSVSSLQVIECGVPIAEFCRLWDFRTADSLVPFTHLPSVLFRH